MEVNNQLRPFLLPLLLGSCLLILIVVSLGTLSSNSIGVNSSSVGLQRVGVNADVSGGSTGTTVSNYSFLVTKYNGYSYADAIKHYLNIYLRVSHSETIDSISIDEGSFKQVDASVSTFTASYGNNQKLAATITLDAATAQIMIEVTNDAGKSVHFSTGNVDVNVVN